MAAVAPLLAGLVLWAPCRGARAARYYLGVTEVSLTSDELKKLDTFEGHTLAKADQAFLKKQYRQARAEYDSFIKEFPRSKAIAYALMRKARCAEMDDKRFKAITDYQEVLDYFPNAVRYAAAALYHIGDCHWRNGDIEKAMKAWAQMADDKEYRKQVLAAFALNRLADNLMKRDKPVEAVRYYEQVAATFRGSNVKASDHARDPVIVHYIRTMPNEPKFREFYKNMKGFERSTRTMPADLAAEPRFWYDLRAQIRHHGTFTADQVDLRGRYYSYWAAQMKGKFPKDDDFHIERARFQLLADANREQWYQALDRRYNQLQKPGDWRRTYKWMAVYGGHKAKIEEYFKKIDIGKVKNPGRVLLMRFLWARTGTRPLAKGLLGKLEYDKMSGAEKGSLAYEFYEKDEVVTSHFLGKIDWKKMPNGDKGSLAVRFLDRNKELSRHVVGKIAFGEMSDDAIAGLAGSFWHRGAEKLGVDVCNRIKDIDFRKNTLLNHYYKTKNAKAGLPLATHLTKVAKYATSAWWIKGQFLHMLRKYAEAIAAYKNCQNEPTNLWEISDCLVRMGKLEAGVAQVREIENFFKSYAPRAAYHVAQLYRRANLKKKQIAALRHVLKKYPESGESRRAHESLEKMGIKMGGGVDAN